MRGAAANHILTDLVSLVRFAMHQENELVSFPEKVQVNFRAWLTLHQASGKRFTDEQRKWLEMVRDHIADNLQIETDDFDSAPFVQKGGIGKVYQIFDDDMITILNELNELNEALVA